MVQALKEEKFELFLTKNESKIILILRGLRPFEHCDIAADKNGKIDSYIVTRTFKEVLTCN